MIPAQAIETSTPASRPAKVAANQARQDLAGMHERAAAARPPDSSDRQAWIDIAKGVGISAVVVIHDFPLAKLFPYAPHAARFAAVPLFFMLSGVTMSGGDAVRKSLERAASLMWVFFFASLLLAPLYPAIDGITGLAKVAYGSGTTLPNPPLWFLPCLAVSMPLAACLVKLASGRQWVEAAAVLVLLALAPLTFAYEHVYTVGLFEARGWPWSLDIVPLAVGFLLAGRVLGRLTSGISDRACVAGLVICLLVCAALQLLPHKPFVDPNTRVFHPLLPAIVASLLVPWAIMLASRLFARLSVSGVVAAIGRSSLPILALHWAIMTHMQALADQLGWRPDVTALLLIPAGIVIPCLVDVAIRRTLFGAVLFYPRALMRRADRG